MRTHSPPIFGNTDLALQKRQAVKEIASSLQADLNTYHRIPLITNDVEKLDGLRNRLLVKNQQLALLRAGNLEPTAPAATIARTFKSGAVLSAGVTARTSAVVAASAAGTVQAGVLAVSLPLLGIFSGASAGFQKGLQAPVACAKPLTAVAGMGLGAVSGGVGNTCGMVAVIPASIAIKGSIPRKTFSFIDQLPRARAYANRKKQSTQEIATNADDVLAKLLGKIEEKREQAQFFASAPAMMRDMFVDMHQMMADETVSRR